MTLDVDVANAVATAGHSDLGRALTISLALHALLLWQLSMAAGDRLAQAPQATRANFLNADLHRRGESLMISPRQPVIAMDRARSQQLQQSVRAISPDIAREATSSTQRSALPDLAAAPIAAPQESVVAEAIPSSTSAKLDADGLRQYRVNLAVAARRLKSYPAQALANGWQGNVEIRLTIAANGIAQPAQLLRGSGYALLDAAALDMLGSAVQSIEVPPSLRSQAFTTVIPIDFTIDMDAAR